MKENPQKKKKSKADLISFITTTVTTEWEILLESDEGRNGESSQNENQRHGDNDKPLRYFFSPSDSAHSGGHASFQIPLP